MKTSYKRSILLFVFIMSIGMIFTGCSNTKDSNDVSEEVDSNIKTIRIVASLFPQYDFAKIIGGDYVNVSLIIPSGVEPHAFEPTPKDIIEIKESDIFLYTNELMEPWAHELIETDEALKTTVVDLSAGIELIKSGDDHLADAETEHEHEHEEGEYDPHYWLDPQNAIQMVQTISSTLISKMPENEAYFTENANKLIEEINQLDQSFKDVFAKTDSNTILSGGHFAFGYFAAHYGLEHMSPYTGFSPNAEPTPKKIALLLENIKDTKAKAIFYEELIDPRVARIISEEGKIDMLLLHGGHNVSKDELESGITYVEIMKGNLERLKKGLGYHE